jgi:hypothetical protein
MMIPGQWEGRPRPPMTPAAELALEPPSAPPVVGGADGSLRSESKRERPGWERVAIYAAALLAASWVAMWLDAPSR